MSAAEKLPPVDNDQFLKALFEPDLPGKVLVCSFAGDPGSVPNRHWKPHIFKPGGAWDSGANNYGVISTFKQGSRRRADHVATPAIMIDDVIMDSERPSDGGKIPKARVKLKPTWANETSENNCQIGYKLAEPITDEAVAKRLIDALIAKLDPDSGDDPGMAGTTRYFKLPVGVNGKPARNGWRNQLRLWQPERVYTLAEICEAYGIDLDYVLKGPGPVDLDTIEYTDGGPVIKALEWMNEQGLVKYETEGKYEITCPWVDDHSEGRDDGACIGKPGSHAEIPGFYFKCHHGHCKDRTLKDVVLHWRENDPSAANAADDFIDDTVDLDGLPDEEPASTTEGAFPLHLLQPPGLVGDIGAYALESAVRPQPVLAVMAGLLSVSLLSRNRYAVERYDTRLNLYALEVCPTGGGKEHPYRVVAEVARLGDASLLCRDDMSSGAALVRELSESPEPRLFLFLDEIWQMLSAANSETGNVHKRELTSALMSLYTKANSVYMGKGYANTKERVDPILNPYVTFAGATTPGRFVEALSTRQVADGFLNRLLVFRTETMPPITVPSRKAPSEALIERIQALTCAAEFADEDWLGDEPIPVTLEAQALDLLTAFSSSCDDRLQGDAVFGPLWSRGFENALRVAGVLAVGVDPRQPQIDLQTAQWAVDLVGHCLEHLGQCLERELAESDFDKLCNRALDAIRNPHNYVSDQQFARQLKKGLMPRGKLLKLLKISATQLTMITQTLQQRGQIRVLEDAPRGGKKMVVYDSL